MILMRYIMPFVFFLLIFSSCSEDDGEIQIKLKLEYQGTPVVMLDRFQYPDNGPEFFFLKFSMFMSNLELIGDNTIELMDIDLLNFSDSHSTLTGAEEGFVLSIKDVAPGSYTGLRFDIGVPDTLNAQSPADFSNDHPLASTAEYWEGWNSYIFMKTEGRIDLEGDDDFETGMALHIGSDAVYRSKTMSESIQINAEETTVTTITIDLYKLFVNGNDTYDIYTTPQIHTLEEIDFAIELADNLVQAIN